MIPAQGQPENAATRAVASVLGVLLGISSIDHGLLEMLQGNRPTPGFLVKALGPGHSWAAWTQGSEPAFTLVHNFLLTGVLATSAGLLLIVWSLRFIRGRGGAMPFLLFSAASFLVGGGLAQFLPAILAWAAATRVRASLAFWRRLMMPALRRALGSLWRWALVAEAVLFLTALEISSVGYFPGLSAERQILVRVLWRLALAIILAILLSIVSAFASDIEAREFHSARAT